MKKKSILAAGCAVIMACTTPAIAEEIDVASTFATSNLLGQMGVKFADNVSIAGLKLHGFGFKLHFHHLAPNALDELAVLF